MPRHVLAAVLVIGGTVLPTFAAEQVLRLDPHATEVSFSLGSTLHTVHGTFSLARGVIVFDDETGKASGRVVVDAASARTGNKKRDKKMHTKVLESQKFPQIVFNAEHVEGRLVPSGSGPITLRGTISLHGKDHPITIDADVSRQNERVTATFHLPIPYVAWGLEDPSVFVLRVAKEVLVEVDVHGTVEKAP